MVTRPRILVFQHIAAEHPGIFRDFLREDSLEWDAVELDEGESIPDLRGYDGLWVMGGPMDTWEEDQYPWLREEKLAIRKAVLDLELAYLGVCLGHQLLADALGGEVAPSDRPEVGILEVEKTRDGGASPFLEGVPTVTKCLQWHGAEVKHPPQGSKILVSSPLCRVQAMSVGERAFSVQYHVEITRSTVSDWAQIPAYKTALEQTMGANAIVEFAAQADTRMASFNEYARRLYDNWTSSALGWQRPAHVA